MTSSSHIMFSIFLLRRLLYFSFSSTHTSFCHCHHRALTCLSLLVLHFRLFFLPVKLDEKKEIIRYFFLFRSFFLRLSLSLAALFFTLSSSFFCLPISTFTVITTIIASWACLSDLLLLCMHIYL